MTESFCSPDLTVTKNNNNNTHTRPPELLPFFAATHTFPLLPWILWSLNSSSIWSMKAATDGHHYFESLRNMTLFFHWSTASLLCSLNYPENQFGPDLHVLDNHYRAICSMSPSVKPLPHLLSFWACTSLHHTLVM